MYIQEKSLTYQAESTVNEYDDIYSRNLVYKDLDLRFMPHPLTGNISPLENINAVKRAVINIVLTEPGERPFNQYFGTPLNKMLFNFDQLNPLDLQKQIKKSIEAFEPRVKIKAINISDQRDSNEIGVSIIFYIINVTTDEPITIQLKRLR